MVIRRELRLQDGRTLSVHDSAGSGERTGNKASATVSPDLSPDLAVDEPTCTIVWFHGSPQTGALLEPLLEAAAERGIRLLSYGRPDYGGSTPVPDRDVASAAADVEELADALGLDRFAVLGASGGGPHALACAALLPGRVTAAACVAGLAPIEAADDIDWFAGMAGDGPSLRAALDGREARERFEETAEFDPTSFNARDYAVLDGTWASLGADVGLASAEGTAGIVDDDLAFVRPWGFDVADIACPVLLVQGTDDRVIPPAHAEWLLHRIPRAELWLLPGDGHISALDQCPAAMDWLLAHTGP
ncbi:alpha/beta fold hydrolase [Plantibacter sp. YIM 135347]|uniref:alpha/beta fold hydrolase n=1 Tax=Plantibacter sp. YIM 135347 TaxID=3423919 RepID=UPI003D352377